MLYDVAVTQIHGWKYQIEADSEVDAHIKAAQYFDNADDGVTGVCTACSVLNTSFDAIPVKTQQNLSVKMLEVLEKLRFTGEFIRYDGGFWSWAGVELKPLYNGGRYMGDAPVWHCDVKTLRALQKRGLVKLDEVAKICILVN